MIMAAKNDKGIEMTKQQTDFMKELLGGLNNEITRQAQHITELEQELARYQSKYNNLLAVAHRDGGHYLAQHGEEKAGKAAITAILAAYHSNDRYQGAVEVEGEIYWDIDQESYLTMAYLDSPDWFDGQQVRVLVMEV